MGLTTALSSASGDVIHVDGTAKGGGTGTTWADAYVHLEDALGVAVAGDQIWVAAGTYRPDQGTGLTPGDRFRSFTLLDGVTLLGSFPPGGGEPGERDLATHP
ncbi:MAG: hypothetical protein KDM81_12330, partial [Verrucomicrobiae bacterium]|nr:hypothetical protein [Verrucomicrobiae bacterium]